MANAINGNTIYVDTTGSIGLSSPQGVVLSHVIVTATAASAQIVIRDDATSPVNKLDLRVPTSGDSKQYDFSDRPIVFPEGIEIGTVTNAVATLVFSRGPGRT